MYLKICRYVGGTAMLALLYAIDRDGPTGLANRQAVFISYLVPWGRAYAL